VTTNYGKNPSCTISSSSVPSLENDRTQVMWSVVSSASFTFSSSNCTFFPRPVFDWLSFSCVLFNWQVCLFLFFKRILRKLLPAQLLVLEVSVCCQSLGSNDTFCDFCRFLIAACSRAAFLKVNNLHRLKYLSDIPCMDSSTPPHIREWDVPVTYRLSFSYSYFPFLRGTIRDTKCSALQAL